MNYIPTSLAMKCFSLLAALSCYVLVNAQSHRTMDIGKFELNDIINYPDRNIKINDLKGKIVILDFWSKYCASCIASFPKMNALAKKYERDIAFFMVATGATPKDWKDCKTIFDRHTAKYDLQMPNAFDSVMYKAFDIPSVPHAIVLNRRGEVIASVFPHQLTDSVLSRIVNDQPVSLVNKPTRKMEVAKTDSTFANQYYLEASDDKVMYRSVFTKGQPPLPIWNASFSKHGHSGNFRIYNIPGIDILARFAAKNEHFRYPLNRIQVETTCPSKILDSVYCYELVIPAYTDIAARRSLALRDVATALDVVVEYETKSVPCYVLLSDEPERIYTKGGTAKVLETDRGLFDANFVNQPIKRLVSFIDNDMEIRGELPVVDETVITGNIDIFLDFDRSLPILETWQKALAPYGLRLEPATRTIEVLTVKDRNADD